ncbi:MAG: NitT/TauT family transport system substrate-binding protein [Marmoricola sp.]|nr:NitT/TauT family transport system substrate-binding protein [Marmoricola sp.]
MTLLNRRQFNALAASAAGLALPAWAQPTQTVKIGSAVRSIFSLPLYVADQKGFFREQGLVADVSFFSGGPPATAALLGGSVDFVSSAVENQLKLAKRGQRVVSIMAMQADFSGALVLHKSAADKLTARLKHKPGVKDLRGLRIATLARGGFADMAARYIFADAGLDPDKDVELIPVRGYDKVLAAAQAGEIDGSLMVEPWQTIAVEGGKDWEYVVHITLGEGPKVFKDIGYVTLQTTPRLLAENRPLADKVVTALVKAQRFIAPVGNLDELVEIAQKVFPSEQPRVLRTSIAKQQASFRPALHAEMITKNMELLLKNKAIEGTAPAVADLFDNHFAGLWNKTL